MFRQLYITLHHVIIIAIFTNNTGGAPGIKARGETSLESVSCRQIQQCFNETRKYAFGVEKRISTYVQCRIVDFHGKESKGI